MKEKKLKAFVLPTVYCLVIGVLFISIAYLGNILQSQVQYEDLAVSALTDNTTLVTKTEENVETSIVKPYSSESVQVSKSFYDMQDDETTQQKSLVYYENTYLQNSGVIYTSTESFDVICSTDGTVTNVAADEVLGNYVEVTHNTNLKTIYYSLGEINVKKDDVLKTGDIIGKSGDNMLESESNNSLLFEVYHNGFAIDPEEYYNMSITDLS